MRPRNEYILHPGADVFLRGDDAVQFGLDSARAGIVATTDPGRLAMALAALRRPTLRPRALRRLMQAGLSRFVAEELIDELLTYGILQERSSPSVVLIGTSPLATACARQLGEAGFRVHRPYPGEPEDEVVADICPGAPLVIVDRPAIDFARCITWLTHRPTVIPVLAYDARGIVGPARIADEGPCPVCLQLHWVDQDEHFHQVATQIDQAPGTLRQDPVAIAATAAGLTGLLLQITGQIYTTTAHAPPRAGEVRLIDPYAPARGHAFVLARHDNCPVCFAAEEQSRAA
ncbi:hypothetical protein C3B44_02880 [Corynebacterium yudongzhengii]|uniref:Bacteriocin biosynthesis cyclodehydratase domain-containing protein n=1 Tax=Corynebacterium yudongzhengii TaxID=2080740 RepID=A0A2U1T509_9CORY|nr:hypothetical protein [Corynebacterium yudongzhengii]AWB81430.1 hypothetical protein C3B44_02880 [Corynebacterium yudongzhengii]PWC01072.1 hypothetical protein DF222_09285 [Corynebacterium yudongzhengii]